MALPSAIEINMHGNLSGQQTLTRLFYYASTNVANPSSRDAAQTFKDDVWSSLRALLSFRFTCTRIDAVWTQIGGANSPPFFLPVNEVGQVGGESLPPYCTVSLTKLPDNTTIDPSGGEDFRNGAIRVSGIPETHQADGYLVSSVIANWTTVASNFLNLDITGVYGSSAFLTLGMFRPAKGANPRYKAVLDALVVSSILGTQNTRKI